MTVEELKALAAGMGYRVVRNSPKVEPLLPCVCGRKRITDWYDMYTHELVYQCPKCGREARAITKKKLKAAWNEAMRNESAGEGMSK